MKFYMCMQNKVVGPYLPEEITGIFGGVSPETLTCTEPEFSSGRTQWRRIVLLPELAACVKREISEPLAKYSPDSPAGLRLDILSTDDDSNIRALLWHMLTDAGHTVEFAKDGEEVFKRLAAKTYDLVILDVNMPKMNGYKVSELLHEKLPNPPKVIIFTGRDLEKERLQFVCSGADAILSKGTGNDRLIQTIEGLFHGKPGKPAPAEEVSAPRPAEPVIERFYAAPAPGIPAPPEPVPAVPPATAVLQPMPEVAAAAGAIVRNPDKPAPPPAPPRASGHENDGKLAVVLDRLLFENKALKTDLVDIRRLLGHIELEYTQLEGLFEKQALKLLDRNQEAAGRLGADWQNLRNYVTLTTLFLLVTVLAVMLLG